MSKATNVRITAFLRSISSCSLLLSHTSHCCSATSKAFTDIVPPHRFSCLTVKKIFEMTVTDTMKQDL